MEYTPNQRAAITIHDRNLIVTAGAGSGKTRVLVDRFVAVLDAHPDWTLPSLVAITFTEKAAREMRDRVRQSIEQRIAQATETNDDTEVERWRDHEAALDRARIGTIHSLCATILRANAAEIGIDPGFEVLDEVNAAILLSSVLDQQLARLADEGHLAARLISEYGLSKVRGTLSQLLGQPEDSWPKPISYLEQWQDLYTTNARQVIQGICDDTAFMAVVMNDPGCQDTGDKLMQSWLAVLETRDGLSPDDLPQAVEILTRWLGEIKLNVGKAAAWGGPDGLKDVKSQLKLIRERAEAALEEIGTWTEADEQAAVLLPLWAEAAARVKQAYRAVKNEQRALDFDDLEMRTRQLLQDESVGRRYRNQEFKHVLVDEFQDTNEAQRDIIYALADLDRPGSLFVVGDPRQSIYKFRGADVSVFDHVRQDILDHGGQEIPLDTSFRTHQRLVDELNAIFTRLLVRQDGPTAKYEVEMGPGMTGNRASEGIAGPYMQIILIDKEKAAREPQADDMRRWEALALAQHLQQMVDAEVPVWDKQAGSARAVQWGDMAVLFQSSRSMPLVEEVFKAAEIPYVTVAGKGYFNRPEIEDLRSLLDALYNPFDDLALAAALRSPLYGLSDDTLLALRWQRDETSQPKGGPRLLLWSALTAREIYDPPVPELEVVQFARQSLERLHAMAGRVTIAELLARALDDTAYLATLSGLTDGARRCENVQKLIEVSRRSRQFTLGDFTAYLQDLSEREAREGEALVEAAGSIHLMTVHASKGLEFPVVSLFDISWKRPTWSDPLILDPDVGPACSVIDDQGTLVKPFAYQLAERFEDRREHAERTRLLYVGMTRAQDYVIVSGQKQGKGQWLKQIREALDLPDVMDDDLLTDDYRVHIPQTQPDEDQYVAKAKASRTGWDRLGTPLPGPAERPPLVVKPPSDPHAPARALQATDIALLGRARVEGNPGLFRRSVLREAPDLIHTVARGNTAVTKRIIGEMVHQALRWWRLPGNTPDLRRVLDSYAWEQGLTDRQMIEEAISRAADLLERTEGSKLFREINESGQVYRELPFTFKLGERAINGVIDVLYFSKYQRWTVVDYKTSFVGPEYGERFPERIAAHAERYHAQIAVYAAAVESLTGQTPDTYLHYVRYVHTLRIAPETWRAVLQSLDADIAEALADQERHE